MSAADTDATDIEDLAQEQRPTARRRRSRWSSGPQGYAILVVWALLIAYFSLRLPDTFATLQNFQAIANSRTVLLLITLGLIFPLAAGEFDLSIGAAMSMGGVLPVYLATTQGIPIGFAIGIGIVCAVVFGLFNGVLVVMAGIPSLVVTLGSGTLLTGLLSGIAGNDTFTIGTSEYVSLVRQNFLGFSAAFWFVLVVCVLAWYVLQHTPVGRHLYFVGQSREVARLAGVRTSRYRYGSLVASATLAAAAGALLVGNVGSVQTAVGSGYLLPAFAAAFLGSTAIVTGRFNAFGALVATYFLETGITGLQQLGYQDWVSNFFYGSALILAVLVATIAGRIRARARS
jgi:ribose transport system permease protein